MDFKTIMHSKRQNSSKHLFINYALEQRQQAESLKERKVLKSLIFTR